MKFVRQLVTLAAWMALSLAFCRAQPQPPEVDPGIAQYISTIWAVDNHAHPVLAPPLDETDREFDALPATSLEPQSDPVALRPDFPLLGAAWKALYDFDTPPPLDAAGLTRLKAARERVKTQQGENYPARVLDKAKIGTMLANRVAMGRGVEPPRFRWVPYVDALLFPFDNSGLAAVSPDRKTFFALEDQVRAKYFKQAGISGPPATLDEYLSHVVTPILEQQKAGGAVAEKFEVAYLRSFDFSDPPRAQVENIYSKWVKGGVPDAANYKLLQDFLFRYIAMECGRLGMAVHLHAMAGAGSYFSITGVNPLLLEPLFNDPRLRKTNFVLLHGGWPYVREIGALLQKPNVYLDISSQDLIISSHTEAIWLREWLEMQPQKVLFGTDGYAYSDEMGWPEATWIASQDARKALAISLTGMLRDNEISRERANEIARMVLRGNAEALYRFQSSR
ncbi:MAG TPA: amidohydrolase family protein [Acidobacteriaceae bacterium]|nr:amidohydrolase family protein [Acidobacteriaceae bacterium]